MPRFFLPQDFSLQPEEALPKEIYLDGEDAFHLSVSLRARIGDPVLVCTAQGVEISCTIASVFGGKKDPKVVLTPLSAAYSKNESPVSLTVMQGVPKGKKIDSILQKCTELGAQRIVLVYMDRSVPSPGENDTKLDRYQKIVDEAAKQCGRAKRVSVEILPNLDAAIPLLQEAELAFACYEEESEKGLKEILSQWKGSDAAFLIGPEGGISNREVLLLNEAGIPTVTLGKRILRTETAASAVLSIFLYEMEL